MKPALLREVQVGFHLAPADEAGKALAAAVYPAGELAPDGGVFGVGLYLAKQGRPGEVAGADIVGEGEQGVELMLGDREPVGHPAFVIEPQGEGEVVFEDYSELRDPFVTIVTESAFSVTSIVTITNHPTYSLIVDLSMSRAKEE